MRRDLLLLVLGAATGWAVHWWAYRPVLLPQEKPAPEIIINEKVRVVEKVVVKDLPRTVWQDREVIRTIEVTATPSEPGKSVKITVELVEDPDGSLRAVASADGKVVAATDKVMAGKQIRVVETEAPEYRWTAGVVYGQNARGVFVNRNFGRIHLGVEAARTQHLATQGWDVRAQLGVRF